MTRVPAIVAASAEAPLELGTIERRAVGEHDVRISIDWAGVCRAGEEQYCERGNTGTYGAVDRDGTVTQGGYSTEIVVTENFVLRVPE